MSRGRAQSIYEEQPTTLPAGMRHLDDSAKHAVTLAVSCGQEPGDDSDEV